jgi:soluble lytic murein transglycosylase-like protein
VRLVAGAFLTCLALIAAAGSTPRSRPSAVPAVDRVGSREVALDDDLAHRLDGVEQHMAAVEAQGRALMRLHRQRIAPVAALLERRTAGDSATARRTALALVREGHAAGVDPRLLAAVLLVENPWLDPAARSPAGAVGLMQIMPFHAGRWGCEGNDLEHPETNICHGARILAEAIRRTQNLETALLRYNGCRLGTNTPDCRQYPLWVYGRAGPEWMTGIGADLPS